MRRNLVRISLDMVMLVLLVLMYEAQAITIAFHEVGGLVACGLFLVHHGINWRWIVGVSSRFFRRSLPVKTRVGYLLNVVLLVLVVFIALTGIMISRTIFVEIYGTTPLWRFGHLFASALALVLVGIHTGLHWSFIRSMFTRYVKLPHTVAKLAGVVCLVAVLGFGIYSIVTTNFTVWLAAPLAARGMLPPEMTARLLGGGGLPGSPIQVIAAFGSIAAVFAATTVIVENALRK